MATEGTLDSYLYQIVVDKARFIAQLLDGKCPARVSEDCDERVLTTAEIQAAAEGNPDFKRRIEVSNEIIELTMQRNEYLHETAMVQKKIEQIPEQLKLKKEMLTNIQNDKKSAEKINDIVLTLNNGSVISDKKAVNTYLIKMAQEKAKNPEIEISAKVNDFEISICHDKLSNEVRFQVTGNHTYFCNAGTTENQDNYQRLINLFEKAIQKSEEDIKHSINNLETNLEQAKNRVAVPFAYEKELEDKIQEFQKLDEKLSELSVQEDIVYDPEEEPM